MSTLHLNIAGCPFPVPAVELEDLRAKLARFQPLDPWARHELLSMIWGALDYRLFAFGSDGAWKALWRMSVEVPETETEAEERAGFAALIDAIEQYDRDNDLIP
jgi:hypothetical protein